jgi:Ca2+-binding EF-hand superfamily protein
VNARTLLAAVPLGLAVAAAAAGPPAAPPDAVRFAAADRVSGSAAAAPGSPLARGGARPTRPRGDAFVPGQLPVEGPPAARVRGPFRADEVASFPDRMDVVFYAKPRPVRVQVSIRTDGKPMAERWEAHLKKLFAAFDRDGDGYLNRYELEHIFPLDGMRQMFAGGQYYRSGGSTPTLESLDKDGDGRVSFPEFVHYYRDVVTDLVRARHMPGNAGGDDTITRELFARLDQDKDGKLSEAELRAAEKILLALDADEDECVSVQELLANPIATPSARDAVVTAVAKSSRPTPAPAPPAPPEVVVYQTGIPGAVVQQIIKKYDKDGDYELTREEVGFPKELFDKLDTNGDGKLSATELDAWRTCPPDAVVVLELGDTPQACKASATPPDGGDWPEGVTLRQTVSSRLVLRVGAQSMEFAVSAPPPGARRQMMQQGPAASFPQGAKSVTEKDLVGPQNQFLRVVFDDADFDGDGVLTRQEFEKYFELQRSTTEVALSLTYAVRTPNLFQMLDDNMDGKLGVRELRTAWDRMIVLEPPGATAVTKAILQPNVSLRLSNAAYANYDASMSFGPQVATGRTDQVPRRGPLWFQKMDRNGDGDVSRSEFLGSEADFRMLDADGDGLISVEEAEAYEKKARPPKPEEKKTKPEKESEK